MEHLARATRIALVVQKVSLIMCYQPLSFFLMLIFAPWFFLFDYLCVEVLLMALKSESKLKRYPAVFTCILLILCSTAFACAYYETKAELDWHWAIEVFKDWQLYRLFVARGIYNFMGVLLVFIPLTLAYHFAVKYYNSRREQENEARLNLLMHDVKTNADYVSDFQEKQPANTYTRGRKMMILGAIFAPGLFLVFFQPWMRLSATLLWDIVKMLVLMVVPHHLPGAAPPVPHPADGGDVGVGHSSFYDPKKDPYYVNNFKEDLDPRIKEALQKAAETGGFRNIIHIALESMRADVFPYVKDGLLDQSIKDEKLMDIDSELLTPFLNSIAEHTLSFDNMQATVAYTHKSMLGYFCGQLPLAVDFTREVLDGSTMYQTCWPNVLRQLGPLQDENPDELNFLNDDKYKVKTEKWSTANIAAFTGQWDHTHQIFRKAGFETIIDGENILKVLPERDHNFDIGWGFHDEYSVKTFWKYVDQYQKKAPRDRMLISWMGTTTHEPFDLNPHWTNKYYKEYIRQPEGRRVSLNKYLNGVHWSDMLLKEIILGFRERGLEDDTLFVVHGDHGFPWIGEQKTPVRDSHNEVYNIPFLVYNPRINNPGGKKIPGDHYTLGIPSTILDLLISTNSFSQEPQKNLAKAFAQRYEYSQSFLRPMKTVNRMFFVNPGGSRWIVDNGHNLRVLFSIDGDFVRLLDYIKDPVEVDVLESYAGINGLIRAGAEEKFGKGTTKFLKEAYKRHLFMKTEMPRRYTGQDYLD